ncbi:FtsX-like permease family protein [Paracoccus limosus]|uniref:FtsX-like permease family protein n=1 Tax=Paracoccus limosus TaxID=913252 RepID=A0A844H871_9RHOB|nr:ABC transporter permease [Paracoccus limosus]MTH36305.1 FtsX-like permease family protein [Paracoccus limosus]
MLRFILADLGRMKAGAVVIVLLIALAVALGLGVSLSERALRLGSARASDKFDLVIGAPGSETQLVLSTVFLQPAALPLVSGDVLAALARDPRVSWAAPVGFGDFHRGWPVIGTTTQLVENTAPGLAEGRIFAAEGEAVIGATVGLAVGDAIRPTHGELSRGGHDHEDVSYRITGRLQATGTPWDRAILVPIQAVWHLHGLETGAGHDDAPAEAHDEHEHGHGFDADAPLTEAWQPGEVPGLPAILVKPSSIANAYKLRQEYRQQGGTMAVFPAEVLTSLYGTLGDARQVLAAVAAATQGLVAAALLLVTMVHIGQRRRQIGALRALGAPRGAIFALVWAELFALIAAGIVLGVLGGWLAASYLGRLVTARQGFPLPVEFSAGDLAGLAILAGFGALMAALPAWIAYRQSPAASLRQ